MFDKQQEQELYLTHAAMLESYKLHVQSNEQADQLALAEHSAALAAAKSAASPLSELKSAGATLAVWNEDEDMLPHEQYVHENVLDHGYSALYLKRKLREAKCLEITAMIGSVILTAAMILLVIEYFDSSALSEWINLR